MNSNVNFITVSHAQILVGRRLSPTNILFARVNLDWSDRYLTDFHILRKVYLVSILNRSLSSNIAIRFVPPATAQTVIGALRNSLN